MIDKTSRVLATLICGSMAAATLGFSSAASAQTYSQSRKPAQSSAGQPADDGKLDVNDLEKKYWAAKDADFSVVQNRAYSKVGRFAVTGQFGFNVNNTYSNITAYRLGLNYYFSERWGAELNFESSDPSQSKSTQAFISQFGGVAPNYDVERKYYGASLNWVPIYAKMSFLNSRIIYFDMAFSPGIGLTQYEQEVSGSYPMQTAPTVSFDVSQHFFFTNHFAIRIDFQNRWYNENISNYQNGSSVTSDTAHTSILLLGIQYFF